jgi:hypothetical protein
MFDNRLRLASPAPASSSILANLGLVGTASCSMRGCHGGLEHGANPSPSSYTTWSLEDRHAKAYLALLDSRGRDIAKNLHISAPEKDERCLACHTNPRLAHEPAEFGNNPEADVEFHLERTFGVGCEVCHGPAKDWLVPHTERAWQSLPAEQKVKSYYDKHMTFLQALDVRAGVCAGCHVGARSADGIPERDVTHELIAAGHPRLMFEFSAFLANVPKHWTEKSPPPNFAVRAWAVGQIASARAALVLLADRADRAQI